MAPCFMGAVVFAFNNYHIYHVYTQIMSASPLRGRTKIQLACYTFKNY